MLTVKELRKSYMSDLGPVEAVKNVSFTIEEGQFYTLLGPSGCGKSTTLRCIAGLEKPDSGTIVIGETTAFDSANRINVPGNRRNIGMVFQSYAIWPHMTVYDNVAFPLVHGRIKVPSSDVKERVMEALRLVQLESMATRPAPNLSGGQQQRVAVARALVCQPRVLLLDEPLSNLDARLREDMRRELRALVTRLHLTTLYVTHDQVEALSMSDRVAVMRDGLIVQEGSPTDIYMRPAEPFIAQFVGKVNLLEGRVLSKAGDGLGKVSAPIGEVVCRLPEGADEGDSVLISIRPEHLEVSSNGEAAGPNAFTGELETVLYIGESWECHIKVGEASLQARIAGSGDLTLGRTAHVSFDPQQCVAFKA